MNAILELEKRGYVFKIRETKLTFYRTTVEQQNDSEDELRKYFSEIAEHKAQAIAYLLARGDAPVSTAELEADPSSALAAAMRHPAYVRGLPIWQQPLAVEEALWSVILSERDMQDPAYA